MEPKVINLEEVRIPSNSGFLSGRDSGLSVRNKFNLNRLDKEDNVVKIIIPHEIFSMNTSFFLGLFGDSVRFLGPDNFRVKYIFDCEEKIHRATIERGINKAL